MAPKLMMYGNSYGLRVMALTGHESLAKSCGRDSRTMGCNAINL